MEIRISKFLLILIFKIGMLTAQENQDMFINIEDIHINSVKIFRGVDSTSRNKYYKYLDMKTFIDSFGQFDKIVTRNDEMMETEIVRLIYGSSEFEFFDHSFGEGINRDNYTLYSFEISDKNFWLEIEGEVIRPNIIIDYFYENVDSFDNSTRILMKRKILNETSDYILLVEFNDKKISKISAILD